MLFAVPWCDSILAALNLTVALAAAAWALFVLIVPSSGLPCASPWVDRVLDGGLFTVAAAQSAVSGGFPVVFRNALSSEELPWKAHRKWTPSWLASKVAVLRGVVPLNERHRDFWYLDEARRKLWPSFKDDVYKRQKVDMDSSSFWDLCRNGGHVWHSSTLVQGGDAELEDIMPLYPLLAEKSRKLVSATAWLG